MNLPRLLFLSSNGILLGCSFDSEARSGACTSNFGLMLKSVIVINLKSFGESSLSFKGVTFLTLSMSSPSLTCSLGFNS